ncbi:MAG: hypothetical protein Q4G66_05005 [bacterium]|nr:hypothetical protein [bacterium]
MNTIPVDPIFDDLPAEWVTASCAMPPRICSTCWIDGHSYCRRQKELWQKIELPYLMFSSS